MNGKGVCGRTACLYLKGSYFWCGKNLNSPPKNWEVAKFFFVIEKEKKQPVLFPFQIANLKTSIKTFQILSLTNFH